MGWIDSISVDGLMLLKFNDSLKLNLTSLLEPINDEKQKTQNLNWLNSSIITMFIEPENNWHLEEEEFDIKRLNFTFNCTRFYNSTLYGLQSIMVFQLYFDSPEFISPFAEQDRVFVNLTNAVKAGYLKTYLGVDLRESDFELRKKIRLQMKKNE